MKRRPSGNLQIEIRDRRLRGGRMSLSARTGSAPVSRKREAAVRTLMDRGDLDIVERLRAGELHIADVENAVAAGDVERLRRSVEGPLLLGPVLDTVLAVVRATKAEGTLKQYAVLAGQLRREFGDGKDLREIDREDARIFLHRVRNGGAWSARKQAQVVALAGRVWREAIEREAESAERIGARPRLTRNPWREVETPEVRATRVGFLMPAQWRTLAETSAGRPEAALMALGCLAGLRLREATHLRLGLDLDMDGRRLRVQARAGEYAWRPKTRHGERTIRIGAELHRILEDHIARGFSGARYLITTPGRDRPINPGTAIRWTQIAFEAAGIPYGRAGESLTLHSLRHTFASWLVQRDVQLKKVALLMGDTVAAVEKTYSHLLPTDLDRAVDLLDEIARDE